MHSRTSLYRFVRKHVVRHAQSGRQNLAVIERGTVGQPEVDAAMVLTRAGAGAGVFRNAQRDRGEPLPVLARDRQIVGLRALAKPVLASGTDRHRILAATDANRRSTRAVLCQFPARRIRITEARKPPAGLKAREPGRLPGFDAAKERLKRQIQLAQGLLQRVRTELDEFRPRRFDLRQHVLLIVVADRLSVLLVRADALLERRVVQLTVQAYPARQAFGLSGVRR